MRKHWTDDANRKLRKPGRIGGDGRQVVEYDDGTAALCRLDGVHGESLEREFRSDGELGHVRRDDSLHLLEVCRRCGGELGLLQDADGAVVRSVGGRQEYCSPDCKREARNARDRRRRAKRRGVRPLKFVRRQWVSRSDRDTTSIRWAQDGTPVVPECWAADPWLKFWLNGGVPVGKGKFIDYADPTGATAVRLAERPDLRPLYLEESGLDIPVGKPCDSLRYQHTVFDTDFSGIADGYYARLVLASVQW